MKKIKVLIVDDSAIVRKILSDELKKYEDIDVVGTAPDPFVARDKIVLHKPDVITLDIEMPRMDGLTFLSKLMEHYPLPVIILSTLSEKGGATAMKAIDLGAVEVIAKPVANQKKSLSEMIIMLVDKIKAASMVNLKKRKTISSLKADYSRIITASIRTTDKILALGASTGGTEALNYVMSRLPASTAPTVIVQHMPAYFTSSFAERLNRSSAMEVREAQNGDTLYQGLALLAPGNYHMVLRKSGARFYVDIKDGPLVCHQRPAVDVLFKSVARCAGINAVGVIMTGMGKDGAEGLLNMVESGAQTIGQDEKSCVVYGMPKAAYEIGAVDKVVSLENIPEEIVKILS